MSFFFNVCQQEFCIVFYFVRIDEVVSSRKVLPQISGVLVSLLRMSKSASRYSSFFILIVHSIKHSVESDFFSLSINFSVYIYPVDIQSLDMLFISCYFCCYIFYYTTVFCGEKKIICSNIIVCFVWFNNF